MTKLVLIYGLIASLIIGVISQVFLWSDLSNHSHSEWLGYLVMLIGFSMIFLAIKQHRDRDLGGIITLIKGIKIGLLITIMASIFYVLCWEVYYLSEGHEFIQQYHNAQVVSMRESGASEESIQASIKEMQSFALQYDQWYFRWFVTLLEIFPVGVIITVLSALLLKTKKSR